MLKKLKRKIRNILRKVKTAIRNILEKSEWGRDLLDRRAFKKAQKTWKEDAAAAKAAKPQEKAPGQEKAAAKKDRDIKKVARKTGWTYEKAEKRMKDAKERIGISFADYDKYDMHEVPKSRQAEKYAAILKKKEKNAKIRAKNESYLALVMEETGWDKAHAEEMMQRAKKTMGVSYEHYSIYRFWELDEQTQKTYFAKGDADKLREIYNKDPKVLRQFINKDRFLEKFDKYLGRPWMVSREMDYAGFESRFAGQKKIVYKPKASSGGTGVQVFDLQKVSLKEAYETISRLPEGVIEGYIDQHPDMKKLSPNSVNTLRVVTVQTADEIPGVEPNKLHFVYAGVRMGQGGSFVDNLHQGGMMAILDLETGKIVTNAVDFHNDVYEKHPDTGTVIKGFQVPHFDKVKALIEEAGAGINAYLGWDIAVTADGPVIVEINTHPGADGLQTPYLPEKKGVRHVIAKYLGEAVPETARPEKAEEPVRQEQEEAPAQQEQKAAEKNGFVIETARKSGWTYEEAAKHMKAAKKRTGITFKEYVQNDFHLVPQEQQQEKYDQIQERRKQRAREKNESYIAVVMENTGWDRAHAVEMMDRSKKAMGVSYEHYSIYRFWELDEQTQKTYFAKGDADKLREIYNKDPKLLGQFINKDRFLKKFDKYLGRPWMSSGMLNYPDFEARFADQKKVIYKPNASSGGTGVQVFDLQKMTLKEAYEAVSRLPQGVIEGYIDQHPDMKKLSPNSVNTLRVVTILTQDEIPGVEPNKVHFVYAGVRMGQGSSVVDNLHQGGMIAVLDLETGIIDTNAVDFANNVYEKHPDTGTVIKGFQVPHFDKVKALIEEAGAGIPAYLGWDIAVTADGPVIVEINTHPGADGLQTPYLPEKKGVRHMIAKFLGEAVPETAQPEKKEAEPKARDRYVDNVAKLAGWTYEDASKRMKDARKRLGISFKEYDKHKFYQIPEDQQQEKYAKILERKAKRARAKDEGFVTEVVEHTGWDRAYAEEKMQLAKQTLGVYYEDYVIYRFWELDEQTQKTYFAKGDADRLRDIYNKDPKVLSQFINKDRFCKNFEKYLGRPWLSSWQLDYPVFESRFSGQKKIIYKPKASSGGNNVRVFDLQKTSLKEAYETISRLPEGVIEGYIDQHPEMKKLSPNSVNTLRIVTVQTKDKIPGVEPNKVHFVYAGVRMGQGDSVVDNMHQGGMIAVLDLETGIIDTNAVDFKNRVFEKHPDTGTVIKGFQVPHFDKVKALIEEAGAGIPAYLGWDIAITAEGPVIVEINTHPGAGGLQIPYLPEKKGMRHMVAKYLGEAVPEEKEPQAEKPGTEEKKAKTSGTKKAKKPKTEVSAGPKEPERPYGTKISAITREGIEYYWKKVERASGYQVFRAYAEDGPFEQIAQIDKRNIGTYIDGDFDRSKKTVYYTVRSFLVGGDGTRTYSEMLPATAADYREKLVLEREATYLYSGKTRYIRAICGWGEPEDAQWTSSNTRIATVSQDGLITAVSTGECVLTCTSQQLKQQAQTRVVVNRKADGPLDGPKPRFSFNDETGAWENKNASKTDDAVIMMVGDMMCGKRQMEKQYSRKEGWNFNDSFDYVREITASSDFAVGNLETLLAPGWPYMLDEAYIENMNNCNASPRYLDAVRHGGFDAVVMANNHNCDGGTEALLETIDQVDSYRFPHTGVFRDAQDRRFFLADVNGIKVGYLAYISEATGFNKKDRDWTREEKETHLNVFTGEKAKRDIAACRAAGAEFVIAYMHWGFKNFRNMAQHQLDDAKAVAEAGADYIVGANPHVLQKYEVIRTRDGREVPCFYSTGNFQAVMAQVEGNRDSVIVRLRLRRDPQGKVVLAENGYIPCYTFNKCGKSNWAPVAVSENYNVGVKQDQKKEARERIAKAVGKELTAL